MEKKFNIMIVDDELSIGMYVKKSLEKNEPGFTVTHFTSSLDAYEKLKNNLYDLIITDLKMPEMDGFALAEKIRQLKEFERIPIVIYSSVTESKDRLKALSAPIYADGFISKGEGSMDFLVHQIRSIFWRNEAKEMTEKVEVAQELGKSMGHVAFQSLNAILGYTEILQKNINDNKFDKDKFNRFLSTIKRSATDIKTLVNNVKNLKTIEMVDIGEGDRIIKVMDK